MFNLLMCATMPLQQATQVFLPAEMARDTRLRENQLQIRRERPSEALPSLGMPLANRLLILLVFIIFLAIFAQFASLWLQCKMTRAGISIVDLITMRFRKVNPTVIVRSMIMAVQAGLTQSYPITPKNLEAHYLAGGNVPNVIRALIAAQRAQIDLDWETAQAIDLAGRDILDAVRTSVYPKVIDCPDPKRSAGTLDAVAGDGIQLCARARVTVRTNISQLIGGATEETVIARVGRGSTTACGSRSARLRRTPSF